MTQAIQGQSVDLIVDFFQYPGGPPVDVTNLVFTLTEIGTGTVVMGPTNVGIVHLATGVYKFTWNVPMVQAIDNYIIVWSCVETQANEVFSVLGASSGQGIISGPSSGWDQPIWTCALPAGAGAVTGTAVQAASDVLWALTGRHLGTNQLTIRPCRDTCWGGGWPFMSQWWEFGLYPRPVFYEGTWYNITCGNCAGNTCSCSVISEALMPAPVANILQVKVDGVVLATTAYRVDDYRLLVRTDGGQWPICNDLTKNDTQVGTWSVTLNYGEQVSTLGQMALGELATQFVKLLLCNSDCDIKQPVQQLVRQGVTMNFLDPNEVFPNGHVGLYLCDLFIAIENPNKLANPSVVYDLDAPMYRITNT